jgi:superfamily II DNA helicase RecQ
VLTSIALARPQSRWALRRIRGVGAKKVEQYGVEVLQITVKGG